MHTWFQVLSAVIIVASDHWTGTKSEWFHVQMAKVERCGGVFIEGPTTNTESCCFFSVEEARWGGSDTGLVFHWDALPQRWSGDNPLNTDLRDRVCLGRIHIGYISQQGESASCSPETMKCSRWAVSMDLTASVARYQIITRKPEDWLEKGRIWLKYGKYNKHDNLDYMI